MKAILYNCTSEKNALVKELENGIEYDIVLKSDSNNLINIELALTLDKSIDFKKYNYVYIENLHRYYFVDDINIFRNMYYIFQCSEDVLMSFKDDILNSSATLVENNLDTYSNDYDASNDFETDIVLLDNPFNETSDIIITA